MDKKLEKKIFGTGIWARNKVFAVILLAVLVGTFVFYANNFIETINQQSGNSNVLSQINEQGTSPKTIKIHIDDLPFDVDSKYSNVIRDATSYWEAKHNVFFKEVATEREADVYIRWVKEFGGKTLGHTVYSNFVEIGLGDSLCLGKWQPYSYDTVRHLAMHELGHVLGYDDDYENKDNVMYFEANTKYDQDFDETDVIPDSWSRFYPLCTKTATASYTIEFTSSQPLDVYVVPSRSNYDLFSDGKTFTHYSSCKATETTQYRKTCNVERGSGIILKNPSTFGLGADAQLTIRASQS